MENPFAKEFILNGTKDIGVMVIHGFTSSPSYMRYICQEINKAGYTVMAPLLAGHGLREEALADYDEEDWYQSALDGVNRLGEMGMKQVFAVGHSLGGLLALRLGEKDVVDGVVSVAAPIVLRKPMQARVFSKLGRRRFHTMNQPDGKADMFRYLRADGLSIRHLLRMMAKVRRDLMNITVPVFVIFSKEDGTVHPSSAQIIYDGILSSSKDIKEITGGHHYCIVDSINQYIDDLLKFIQETT